MSGNSSSFDGTTTAGITLVAHTNAESRLSTAHALEDHSTTLLVITYVGASISIVGIVLTLLSYIGYRKFQVKRTHIVMVNLCVCLIIYFVSYLISNYHRHVNETTRIKNAGHPLCVAGTFLCHIGILGAWFWLVAYWFVLLVMYRKPMGGHITHFFLKSAIPSYGIALALGAVCIIVARSKKEMYTAYASELCMLGGIYLVLGLVIPVSIALIMILVVFVYVCRGVLVGVPAGRFQRLGSLKRIKTHLYKLTVLTTLTAIVIVGIVVLPTVRSNNNDHKLHLASDIIFSLISAALGLGLMVLFCIHQDEIRGYWVAILRRDKQQSIKPDGQSVVKHLANTSTNRGESLYTHEEDGFDRQRSTYKMVAKDDTDMTTLGLIQIPGTPAAPRSNATGESPATSSPDNQSVSMPGTLKKQTTLGKRDLKVEPDIFQHLGVSDEPISPVTDFA